MVMGESESPVTPSREESLPDQAFRLVAVVVSLPPSMSSGCFEMISILRKWLG